MKDKLTALAHKEGFRARSVYKIRELHQKYRIFRRKDDVIDIGCWPGSWLQFVRGLVDGRVLGVDQLEIKPIEGVEFIQSDLFAESLVDQIISHCSSFSVVISDVAPSTTGNKSLDQSQSAAMVERVLEIAYIILEPHGTVLIKIFQSGETDQIMQEMRKHFKTVRLLRPKATKKRSKETYLLGKEYHGLLAGLQKSYTNTVSASDCVYPSRAVDQSSASLSESP